ncbi:MAG: protein kinase, partial [Nocardiopsaceae bacterium]|nr:protein kinase [Nocardiopsaceae bacterium]
MSDSETRADLKVVAGRYQLVSELGRGGMGTVWRADDTLTGRKVALKVLRPQQGSSDEDRQTHLRRSLQEARSAARISHPNAVTLYDVIPSSTDDDAIYLIMELVDGPTLTGRVVGQGGTLPAPLVARYGLQLTDVLEAAHELGIVHRDIKPGNILIAKGDQAKLTDFGIAHLVGGTRLTRAGTAGTLSFMAPELFQGQEISAANDIWSLGTTLFYAADGRVPFDRDTDAATMAAILTQEIPAPGCDPALAEVISGMLLRDPQQRWTIPQIREALTPVAGTSAPAAPPVQSSPVPSNPLPWLRQQPVPPSRISDVPAVPADPGAGAGTAGEAATGAPPEPAT